MQSHLHLAFVFYCVKWVTNFGIELWHATIAIGSNEKCAALRCAAYYNLIYISCIGRFIVSTPSLPWSSFHLFLPFIIDTTLYIQICSNEFQSCQLSIGRRLKNRRTNKMINRFVYLDWFRATKVSHLKIECTRKRHIEHTKPLER